MQALQCVRWRGNWPFRAFPHLVAPDGTRAYVAVTGDNRVSVVDLPTLRITQSIETGNGPDGMAWVSLQ